MFHPGNILSAGQDYVSPEKHFTPRANPGPRIVYIFSRKNCIHYARYDLFVYIIHAKEFLLMLIGKIYVLSSVRLIVRLKLHDMRQSTAVIIF